MTLILWSGGFDSTLVLYDECVRSKKKGLAPPRALSISHQNIGANREQRRARKLIAKNLRSRGLKFKYCEVTISVRGKFGVCSAGGLTQPTIWLPTAMLYLKEKEDLLFGWCRSDDAMHYVGELRWIFQYMRDVMCKEGKLELPLEWTHKYKVIRRLREASLISLPWTCEEPRNWKACGQCKPCLDLKTARFRLKLEGKQ